MFSVKYLVITFLILQSCTLSLSRTEIEGNTGPVTETEATSQDPSTRTDISPSFNGPTSWLPKFFSLI
jgi:hypothetical protein